MKPLNLSAIVPIICFSIVGFGLGHLVTDKHLQAQNLTVKVAEPKPEISVVVLEKVEGDLLKFEVSGPARVVWGNDNFVEGDGWHDLPLGQIPDDEDLQFERFEYTANAKTNKFYPSSSYPAGCVRYQHRRFFETKEAALGAGFVASKLVK